MHLNYGESLKKEFEKTFKNIKHEDKDFSLQKRDWGHFEQKMNQLLLIFYLHHKIVKK